MAKGFPFLICKEGSTDRPNNKQATNAQKPERELCERMFRVSACSLFLFVVCVRDCHVRKKIKPPNLLPRRRTPPMLLS